MERCIVAVFDNLYKLRIGSRIYVEDASGTVRIFVAHRLQALGENADASDVFSSSDGTAHLNLITCEGIWNAATKSYSDRLVIFADEEIK